MDPANAVGTATASPYDHVPAAPSPLDHQIDDGSGSPALIRIVKGGSGIRLHFS